MDDEALRELISGAAVVAVVGLSPNPDRPSNQVAWYLHHQGLRLYGVNPATEATEAFDGVPILASLDQVPEHIDIVDVFRLPRACPQVAREAVAAGAGAVWLQLGIRSAEAREICERSGLAYVEDHCLEIEHQRLLGDQVPRAGR